MLTNEVISMLVDVVKDFQPFSATLARGVLDRTSPGEYLVGLLQVSNSLPQHS